MSKYLAVFCLFLFILLLCTYSFFLFFLEIIRWFRCVRVDGDCIQACFHAIMLFQMRAYKTCHRCWHTLAPLTHHQQRSQLYCICDVRNKIMEIIWFSLRKMGNSKMCLFLIFIALSYIKVLTVRRWGWPINRWDGPGDACAMGHCMSIQYEHFRS